MRQIEAAVAAREDPDFFIAARTDVIGTMPLEQYYQKNKMQKLVFLQKMIDLTEMMTGESYNISPKSIAAGKECDKTNKFLQGIYKAAISGDDSGT